MREFADYRTWPDRFSEKVMIGGSDECWPWMAVLIPGGYGQFWYAGRMRNSHRMALLLGGVTLQPDWVVLHECDNRRCCNPKHLRAAPQSDNMKDMVGKGRSLRGERHNSARLTEADVRAIRASNETAPRLAEQYAVKKGTIYDIRYRRSWAHIP